MEEPGPASGTPTPEALLGMLGKLKRTLTHNLSEQKRTTDDKGYIAAANIRSSVTDDVPNLLRPSPGLNFLSQDKFANRTDQAVDRSPNAAGLELESSAPPMDLERPQGSSVPPLVLPQRSSMPSYATPDSASPLSLAQLAQSPDLSMDLAAYNLSTASVVSSEEVGKSARASNVESAIKGQQEGGAESANNESSTDESLNDESINDESSAKAMSAEAEPAVAADSALKSGSAGDTPGSVDSPAIVNKPMQQRRDDKPERVISPVISPPGKLTQALSGDASGPKAATSTEQFDHAGFVQGDREVLGDDGGGERQVLGADGRGEGHLKGEGGSGAEGSRIEEAVPLTEEDLDSAMQELAQEVGQLQPAGQGAAGEGPARQGSYLHRHTSSLILKMSQDAAVPPLPAVANLGPSMRSQATPPAVAPTKPGDAHKTIKSMAASLFRAFDEGKLREQGPPPSAMGTQPAEQPLTATIRTYKSSPKRREAAPTTVQQSPSPARTASYSLQKASLRRSLSPNLGRQAPPLRQPQWDSSKRPSPQRAQRASLQALSPSDLSGLPSDSQLTPQRAQRLSQIQTASPEQAQHAQHAAVALPQPGALGADLVGKSSEGHYVGESTQLVSASQVPNPELVGRPAALTSASADVPAAPSSSIMLSSAAGLRSGIRGQTSRTPTPSPPRFRRLPPNNLTERPAWASTTSSRAAPPGPPGGLSPLRRSTGSATIASAPQGAAPPPHPSSAAPPQSAGSSKAASSAPRSAAVSVRPDHSQGISEPHAHFLADSQAVSDSHAHFLADAQNHAHAQALQQLQQAAEEYHSSSPHVLVPAAVELAAALRRAAKGPAPARLSLEALQLAGLKLKHEGGDGNSPGQSVPTTPWPEWVKGAWGSPQARVRGGKEPATAAAPDPGEEARNAAAIQIQTPQRAQHDTRVDGGAKPYCNGWSPVLRPESLAGRRRSVLASRALAEAEAAAVKSPASKLARPHNPPRATRPSITANPGTLPTPPPRGAARVSAALPRSAATPPWGGAARPSRASATPPRAGVTPPRGSQQAEPSPRPGSKANKLRASSQPPNDGPAAASHRRTGQLGSSSLHPPKGQPLPIAEGRRSVGKAKAPPSRTASPQSRQRENAMQAFGLQNLGQRTIAVRADHKMAYPALMQVVGDTEQPPEAQHSGHAEHAEAPVAALNSIANTNSQHAEAPVAALNSSSNADSQQPSHAEHAAAAAPAGLHSNSNPEPHAVVTPLHSVTSVAALRQSFEQMKSPAVASDDSVKPRTRLPLRKASSKAHVHEDDGSPQQAALLWQHSLRGAHDEHAEDHPQPDHAMQQGRQAHSKSAADAPTNASPLYHTMSAVVAQRSPPRPVADNSPDLGAVGANGPAPWGHMGSQRLTEAVLAAADEVLLSAEKLPVSHRLPVSRSVFDSDEGSLVSSDDQGDDKAVGSSPQGATMHPLAEEATLALLPDRGMSPVSESAEEQLPCGSGRARLLDSPGQHRLPAQHAQRTSHSNQVDRDEVYPWNSLGWAFSPSWIRVICQLCPSLPPHFATALPPHTLQTSLGMHATDLRTYAFDQVLPSSCMQQELAEQASGVIEAVLQGRNSVVIAMGQPAFGKPHTLLGHDPHDPQADSSSLGVSAMLVDTLFSEMQQQRLSAQVQSVYMTAFQIVNETIQDLVQTQQAELDPKHLSPKGSSSIGRHDVCVDKQKRTWVSNLAAVEISSSADFQQMLHLVSCRSSSSSALTHPAHASSPTCIITLLVTADVPTASLPSSVKRQIPNSAAGQPQSPSGTAVQSPTTKVCSKLSFMELGSSTLPVQASPVRTVSAGQGLTPPAPHQLGRGSSGVSMASSCSRRSTLGDRPQGPPAGVGGIRGSVAGGRNAKSQDTSMRSVSEVVWAAAHGRGMPVPYRACKLTRYLQDTLCPSGRAVAVVCINPSADLQTSSTPALTAAERMMTV